jgi:hypothetical protein
MNYSIKNLSKEDQIKGLAESYSDYRAVQKEIREIGGLLKASDSLISSLQYEASFLRVLQKVTEIELVPARNLTSDIKAFEKKSRWIKQAEEDQAELV